MFLTIVHHVEQECKDLLAKEWFIYIWEELLNKRMKRDTAKQVVKLTEAIYYFLPIKVCFTRQGAYKGNGDLNHLDNLY